MNNKTIILTLLLLFASTLKASVEDSFAEANNMYKDGNYQGAIDVYHSILDQGYASAALYYNMGNAYFRNDDLGAAILNYERALKIDPSDKEIQQNLDYANSKTLDRINKVPELFITRWFNGVLAWFSPNQWGVTAIVFMLLLCVCAVVFFLTRSYLLKQVSFYSAILILVLLICSVVNASVLKNRMENLQQAIVMQPTVVIKSSPDENSAEKFIVHEGCKVTVEDRLSDWCKVKISDGNTGWVENEYIETI